MRFLTLSPCWVPFLGIAGRVQGCMMSILTSWTTMSDSLDPRAGVGALHELLRPFHQHLLQQVSTVHPRVREMVGRPREHPAIRRGEA